MEHPEDSPEVNEPPSLWGYWVKRLGWSLLALLAVLGCIVALGHYRATKRLEEALAALDRDEPGWRLQDIEAARESVPDQENSAPVVVEAARRLPKGWPSSDFSQRFAELAPEEQLSDEDFTLLRQELERLSPPLTVAHKLADMSRGRHQLVYKPYVFATLLGDQQETRRVVSLLVYDAMRHDQEKDVRAALRSCRGALNAARSLGDEPVGVSQVIRISGVLMASRSIERALAQGEAEPQELAALQELLRDEDGFKDQLVIACGERACSHEAFSSVESGQVPFSYLDIPSPEWQDAIGLQRERLLRAHPTMLALASRWCAIARLPMHEQSAAGEHLEEEFRRQQKTEPFAVRFFLNPKIFDISRRHHAGLRCAQTALACERYRREHGKWPASLDNLCPHFLPVVPNDPFDGKPLRYQRLEDGVCIYSVSSDGTDNGGNLDRKNPTTPGADIGFRLWDVAKRRQPARPHPKPAPPDPGVPPMPKGWGPPGLRP